LLAGVPCLLSYLTAPNTCESRQFCCCALLCGFPSHSCYQFCIVRSLEKKALIALSWHCGKCLLGNCPQQGEVCAILKSACRTLLCRRVRATLSALAESQLALIASMMPQHAIQVRTRARLTGP